MHRLRTAGGAETPAKVVARLSLFYGVCRFNRDPRRTPPTSNAARNDSQRLCACRLNRRLTWRPHHFRGLLKFSDGEAVANSLDAHDFDDYSDMPNPGYIRQVTMKRRRPWDWELKPLSWP